MNTLEILTLARAKIADEENWCQGSFAENEYSVSVSAISDVACSWCSIGALRSIAGNDFIAYNSAMDYLSESMNYPIADYNDSRTHSEVMAAWDKAIAECSKEYNGN
jgi:hypothetical protein